MTGVAGGTALLDGARGPEDDGPATADAGPAGSRRWRSARRLVGRGRRLDRLSLAVAGLALLTAGGAVAVNAAYNQGHLSPPLDDVYIHLQYARQIGLGEFLRYQAGDAPTTGASSLLYVLLLGAAAALGAGGGLLLTAAVALGVVCFVGTVVGVQLLGRALASRRAGVAAGALTALSGPLLWGSTSGMEVALVAVLVVATLLAFVREQPSARFVGTPVAGALLALTRPEGLVLDVAVLLGIAVVLARRVRRGGDRPARIALVGAWSALPLLAAALQLVLYRALTGSAENTGIAVKSWFAQSLGSPLEVVDRMTTTVRTALELFGGITDDQVVGPGVALLAALGVASLALRERPRRVVAAVLVLGLGGVLVADATLSTALWHNGRYLQPFLPLVLLLAVLGVRALAAMAPDPRSRQVLGTGVLAVLVVTSLVVAPTWVLRAAQQGAAIRESSVSAAAWLKGNTPPGARIGVDDVGAAAYLSDRPVVDLVGLTTPGFANSSVQGAGAQYEVLAHLPAAQRPAFFSRWDSLGQDLLDADVVDPQPLITFQNKGPARDGGPLGGICQSTGGCGLVTVWRADWRHVGSGDLPDLPVPGRIVDGVNVGDLADESAHGYRVDPALVGIRSTTLVSHRDEPGGRTVVDSGRDVVGGETFTLSGLSPGRPLTLTSRVDAKEPVAERNTQAGVVAVDADGRRAGEWTFATDDSGWAQTSTVIPAEMVTGPTLTITLGPLRPYLAPYPDYRSFHYWASQ